MADISFIDLVKSVWSNHSKLITRIGILTIILAIGVGVLMGVLAEPKVNLGEWSKNKELRDPVKNYHNQYWEYSPMYLNKDEPIHHVNGASKFLEKIEEYYQIHEAQQLAAKTEVLPGNTMPNAKPADGFTTSKDVPGKALQGKEIPGNALPNTLLPKEVPTDVKQPEKATPADHLPGNVPAEKKPQGAIPLPELKKEEAKQPLPKDEPAKMLTPDTKPTH